MAGKLKHMERSHRSYKAYTPFSDFERKAQVKKTRKDTESLFEKFKSLFHRTTNK